MMVLLEELPLHPAPAGFNVIGMVKPEVMRLGIMFVIVPEVRIERATVRIYDDVPWHGAVNEIMDGNKPVSPYDSRRERSCARA